MEKRVSFILYRSFYEEITLLEQEEQNEISKKRQLNALRMEMQKAVQEENFERAAELRDQIHSLEQN